MTLARRPPWRWTDNEKPLLAFPGQGGLQIGDNTHMAIIGAPPYQSLKMRDYVLVAVFPSLKKPATMMVHMVADPFDAGQFDLGQRPQLQGA